MTFALPDGSMLVLDVAGLLPLGRLLLEVTALAGLGLLAARGLRRTPARAHAALRATALAILLVAPAALAFRALGLGVLPGVTVDLMPAAASGDAVADAGIVVRTVPLATIVVALWALAALAGLVRIAAVLRAAGRMIRTLPPAADERAARRASAIAAELGLRRTCVRIVAGPDAPGPIAWGWRPPTVALPTTLLRDADDVELDAVLRHELAHVARADHVAWLLGDVVRALLPAHPLAARVRRALRSTAEAACDDAAIAAGVPGDRYAALLLRLVRAASSCTPERSVTAWPMPAMASAAPELSRRVERALVAARRETRAAGTVRAMAVTLALATVAGAAALQPAPLALPDPASVDPARPLVAVPGTLDLGVVAVAGQGRGTLELVNLGGAPVTITGHRATCGCTTVEGLVPGVVRPGGRVSATVRMNAPEHPGETKVKQVHVLLDGLEPLVIDVRLRTTPDARAAPDAVVPSVAPFTDVTTERPAERAAERPVGRDVAADDEPAIGPTLEDLGAFTVAASDTVMTCS